MNKKRPVNLDLTTIKFPYPAIASILHRISGVLLFLAIPLFLWLLDRSLTSADTFAATQALMATVWMKLLMWAILTALIYHLLAGIRHLFMDWGIGEELPAGRKTAVFTIGATVVLSLLIGLWLW